jgi:hypothetical protein
MTKKEALRQTAQENTLMGLGFTRDEAEALRRISMTLHRWHERECGDGYGAIVRGTWNRETGEFDYDTPNGGAYIEQSGTSGRNRYIRIPDRESGAKRRLAAIIKARNGRRAVELKWKDGRPVDQLAYYIQTDPRGAALYILRPGDIPEGADVQSYYDRGICVY